MVEIRTRRLLLRPAKSADLSAIHAILSDPRATAYWSTLPHDSLEQSREWLADMMRIPPETGEDFIVQLEGRVIGKVGLYRFPEIGFILHPEYWRMGLASEALTALLDRAFEIHGLPNVEADVDPRNLASLRLLKGLGFREIGRREKTWLIGEDWCDSVDLRLEARNWRRAKLSSEDHRDAGNADDDGRANDEAAPERRRKAESRSETATAKAAEQKQQERGQ
jgi:RimJ/RimL family protein N-acetyltransferase